MYLSCIVEVSSPSLCLLSPEYILIEPRSFASLCSVHPAMTASTLNSFQCNASLKLPWCLAMVMAQEQQPLWVQTQRAVSSHNIQHQVYILEVQVLLLLAVIIKILLIEEPCFFTLTFTLSLRVVQSCTNTHALSNTLGGSDMEMTAI